MARRTVSRVKSGSKKRSGGSRTKTSNKRKRTKSNAGSGGSGKRRKLHQRVKQDGTGTSRSMTMVLRPTVRMIKNMKALQQYDVLTTQTSDTGTPGVQSTGNCGYLFNASDIQQLINNTATMKGVTLSAVFPTFQPEQKSFKVFLQEVNQYVTFSNVTNANLTLDIYDCIARHDRGSNTAPDTDWQNGTYYDQAGGTLANSGYGSNTPFQTPFYSNLFNRFWKVKKITHVELAQGRSHEHIMKFKSNRILDTERTASSAIIGGLTMSIMYVIRGFPALVTGTNTATLNEAAVACIHRKQYKYRFIDMAPSIYTGSGALSTTQVTLLSEGAGLNEVFALAK